MNIAPLEARGAGPSGRLDGKTAKRGTAYALALALLCLTCPLAHAAPFIWDDDGDRIDDRIESVNLLGFRFAFEDSDTLLRQRIEVAHTGPGLVYGVYAIFDHTPTSTDLTALALLGMPILYRYESAPAVRSLASFAQAQAAANLPGVERIEAVPILYPMDRDALAAIGVRDPSERVFPTWQGTGGANGSGVVVAFLDTGINDAPDGSYPGHESLLGHCLGGASFTAPDSASNTPPDGSENPVDRGDAVTQSHGTHVASIAVGTGGPSGYAAGVAPGARFVDVKVLSDAGIGTAIPEALDWCIHNRARNWGGPPGFTGIDVINLSVSSVDLTDGNDLASRLADRAVDLGIVVVASMGNDGRTSYVPSPAGASRVLAVGALDDQRSPVATDDRVADFNNQGPRADNGDLSSTDELKPDLLAPGVAILGADGSESSDGTRYKRMSGTSMAAAVVSGAVAALRSQYPALTPAQVTDLLRSTSFRSLAAVPPSATGADPRWRGALGYGAIDLYAARLEADQPMGTQLVRLELGSTLPDVINARIGTQREIATSDLVVERAPDQAGAPGVFVPYDAVTPSGSGSLGDFANRGSYVKVWTVPGTELGQAFWYRVSWDDPDGHHASPARRFVSPGGSSVATLEVTIVHNAYDSDVDAGIVTGPPATVWGSNAPTSGLSFPLPGSSAAVSSEWVNGASATGNVAWTFAIEVPHGEADAYLPPTAAHPWRLDVAEGGDLNRSGRITAWRLIWHTSEGDATFEGWPLPAQTLEGHTTSIAIQQSTSGVGGATALTGVRYGPNPVTAGRPITFALGRPAGSRLDFYDLHGRRVGRASLSAVDGSYHASWTTRDERGEALAPGLYFARCGAVTVGRVAVVGR